MPPIYNNIMGISSPTTVVNQTLPCVKASNNVAAARKMWLMLEVENVSASQGLAVLFDASGAIATKSGAVNSDGITIKSTNYDYQLILNNLASTEQYCIEKTEFEVLAGSESQLNNSWLVQEDVPFTKGLNLCTQIEPSTYKNAYQQQDKRLTVLDPFSITRNRALSIVMEPGAKISLRMLVSVALLNG